MAEHKIQGGDMLLFIDPTGGTDYDTVVCLTSVSTSDSVSVVDASSACGPDKSPGNIEVSISFEGQHLQDPNVGTISGSNLLQLLRAEQTIGWKLSPASPVAGDEIQEGTGFISELSSTYSYDTIGVFTMSISPYGLPTISTLPGFYIGMPYGGGYIAYIDGTNQHGLILNGTTPLSNGVWATNYEDVGTSSVYGQGYNNTRNIMLSTYAIGSAAQVCVNYFGGGYTNWFLPNANELFYCSSYISIDNIWTSAEDTYTDPSIFVPVYISGSPIDYDKTSNFNIYAARYF